MYKNKHRVKALFLTFALALVLSIPAMAAEKDAPIVPVGYTATKINHIVTTYGYHYFHNGLIALYEGGDPGWAYMDTKGNMVLTQNSDPAYPNGFDFSEGLAPFFDYNGKVGYADTAGKVVIPAQFDKHDRHGIISVGRFINGNALVFHETDWTSLGGSVGTWTQIDKTGKAVPKTLDENNENVIYSDAQGNTAGVTSETIIISGEPTELEFSEGHALLYWQEGTGYDPENESADFGTYYIISKTGSSPAPTPAAPQASVKAKPAQSKLLYNGQAISLNAYVIGGNNYFKLRDFAAIMLTNEKQFEVTWNAEKNAIELTSGKKYTLVGGELQPGNGGAEMAVPNSSAIYMDGQPISLTAYTIGGNNFFKLRDLCRAFNIFVGWDGATNTVSIDTSKPYTE